MLVGWLIDYCMVWLLKFKSHFKTSFKPNKSSHRWVSKAQISIVSMTMCLHFTKTISKTSSKPPKKSSLSFKIFPISKPSFSTVSHSLILESLLQVLSRTLAENHKRNIDLSVNLLCVFYILSNYRQFQEYVTEQQIGKTVIDVL